MESCDKVDYGVISQSVQIRKNAAYDFAAYYKQLCTLQDMVPLPAVLEHIAQNILDINIDSIGMEDWTSILPALCVNKTLRFLGIRSYYLLASATTAAPLSSAGEAPPLPPVSQHRHLLSTIAESVGDMVAGSSCLTHLELQNLPLTPRDIKLLAKAIGRNVSLSHVSLEYCTVGDDGCAMLCKALRKCPHVISLNLTSTGISTVGAKIIASLIRCQNGWRLVREAVRDVLGTVAPTPDHRGAAAPQPYSAHTASNLPSQPQPTSTHLPQPTTPGDMAHQLATSHIELAQRATSAGKVAVQATSGKVAQNASYEKLSEQATSGELCQQAAAGKAARVATLAEPAGGPSGVSEEASAGCGGDALGNVAERWHFTMPLGDGGAASPSPPSSLSAAGAAEYFTAHPQHLHRGANLATSLHDSF